MPSEQPAARLNDIIENIERIRFHVLNMEMANFLSNPTAIDATERCLQRITEAARKLGGRFDDVYPETDLPELRKFGSVLRHDYGGIRQDLIWLFIHERLPALEKMAITELAKLEC